MPITLRGDQFRDGTITSAKLTAGSIEPDRIAISGEVWDFATGTLRSAAPSGDSDVATKAYVDGVAAGLYWKAPVAAVSTSNITLSGTQTIDSVSVVADDRVLVIGQTAKAENGIYVVAAGAWARSSDMNAGAEFPSAAVFVTAGTVYGDTGWVCTNDGPPTIGTTNIVFVQFSGIGSVTAGAGLSKAGSTLAVSVTSLAGLGFDTGGDAGTLEVKLDANGAIKFNGGALAIKLDTDSGLAASATGVKVLLDSNPGIQSLAGGLSIKLDADSGLQSLVGGLSAKLKANAGLQVDANGLAVKATNGVAVDGSGFLHVNIDGASLSESASGVKVATDGIKIEQQGFRYYTETLSGVTTHFDLANLVDAKNDQGVRVYLNGQRIKQVASAPADVFEYTVSSVGLTTSVDLGAALDGADLLIVDYVAD